MVDESRTRGDWWMGPLNHFAAATCRQAVSTWMGPHRASHSAYPAKITGRTATTTAHDATYDSLDSPTSSAQRSVVCRVAPVQVNSPTAASRVFAKLVCLYCIVYLYMIVAMCLCMVRCVVIQWSRKCGCSCCQFRKLQIVTVAVSTVLISKKPDRI